MLTVFEPTTKNFDRLKESLRNSRGDLDQPREFALVSEGDKNVLIVGRNASKLSGVVAEDTFRPANSAGEPGAQRRVVGEVVWTVSAPFMSFAHRAIATTGIGTLLATVGAALGGQVELALGFGVLTAIAGLVTRQAVRDQTSRAEVAKERLVGAGVDLNRTNHPATPPLSELMALPGPY